MTPDFFNPLLRSTMTVITLLAQAFGQEVDELKKHEGYHGLGFHRDFKFSEWNGEHVVISRLEKNDQVILFQRISKHDLIVSNEKSSEIYFKIHDSPPKLFEESDNMVLVDFWSSGNSVAALFCCNRGFYSLLRAYDKPPKTEKPRHWREPSFALCKGWHLSEILSVTEYGLHLDAIQRARINERGEMEFRWKRDDKIEFFTFTREPKGPPGTIPNFVTFCLKNGVKSVKGNGYMPSVLLESQERFWATEHPMEFLNGRVDGWFSSREEAVKWYGSEFQDKDAAGDIIGVINKASAEGDKK